MGIKIGQTNREFLSNTSDNRAMTLLSIVDRANHTTKFLKNDTNLIVIERNASYLNFLIQDLISHIMPQHTSLYIERKPSFEHQKRSLALARMYTNSKPKLGQPARILARTKGMDSLVEKITRYDPRFPTFEHPDHPGRIAVSDLYAFTAIAYNESDARQLHEDISSQNRYKTSLVPLGSPRDYLASPKNSGYRSLHQYFTYTGSMEPVDSIHLDGHFEDVASFLKNQQGLKMKNRTHSSYCHSKISKPHSLKNYEIVIINGTDFLNEKSVLSHEFVDLSGPHLNGNIHYHVLGTPIHSFDL